MTAKIMVVEDEPIVALHLKKTLTQLRYDVACVAHSHAQAIMGAAASQPDLVLMDINLGGGPDGIETAARIAAPVVFLTAYSEPETLARARTLAPYGYLVKPVSEREVHATIQMALERRKRDVITQSELTLVRQQARVVRQEANIDFLTGLANRRAFERQTAEALVRAARNGRPLSVAFIDLDHFKVINDSAGHAAGDIALREVAQRLRASIRVNDVLARLGGDEFGLLLEGCPGVVALDILSAMRLTVEAMEIEWRERKYALTLSAGLVHLPANTPVQYSLRTILGAADEACYAAKAAGRNAIRVASIIPESGSDNTQSGAA